MTERDFTAAAERYLDMVYRLALNCLRPRRRRGRGPDGHAAAVAAGRALFKC